MAQTAARRMQQHRQRARRYRERQRDGRLSVTLDITPEETDRLYRLHYLTDCELEDRDRIAAAIRALIANIVTDES